MPQSRINGVALSSFLQLLNMEQKTCTLNIYTGRNQGRIFFMKGEAVNAHTGDLTGLSAFYKIMEWHQPNIDLYMECPAVPRQINLSMIHLLMKSQQKQDESRAAHSTGKPPPLPPDMEHLMTTSPLAGRLGVMQAALFKAVGPLAKIIFRDAVRKWIQSGGGNRASLPLLSRILSEEINNPEKEQVFMNQMSADRYNR